MSVTRVGTNQQYSDGWENIFGGEKSRASKKQAVRPAAKSMNKPANKKARKPAKKKSGRK